MPAPAHTKASASKAKEFSCPDCQSTFSRKEYVERHRRLKHLGVRDHGCTECDAAFARSDLLKRHRKTCPAVLALGPASSGAQASVKVEDDLSDRQRASHLLRGAQSGAPEFIVQNDILLYPSPPSLASSSSSSDTASPSDNSPVLIDSAPPPQAPGLDFSLFPSTGSLTSDPMLAPSALQYTMDDLAMAGQALEDMLGGTQPPATSTYDYTSDFGAMTSSTSTNDVSYTQNPYNPSTPIEASPEAQALAEYFNRGGVGGITALDLGFHYEPSFYPDHLFEPQSVYEASDPKYFYPKERFPFSNSSRYTVPRHSKLTRWAEKATKAFLPSMPVVHAGSLDVKDLDMHTAFALTVIGGAYDPNGRKFTEDVLVAKRVYIVEASSQIGLSDHSRFTFLQSMLLYQLLGLFHRHQYQRQLAISFHGSLVMMTRQCGLVKQIKQVVVPPVHSGLAGAELKAVWMQWIKAETMRRVAFIVYLCDLETATTLESTPCMSFSELAIDLPAANDLWDAPNAEAWLEIYLKKGTAKSLPFIEALQALLRTSPPAPYSTDAIILAELSHLGAFPLLVLTRTLSFLEQQTTNESSDPLRLDPLAEGQKRHESLERIRFGRALLRKTPGGVKRAGGEKWWQDVMPQMDDQLVELQGEKIFSSDEMKVLVESVQPRL